MEYDITNLCLEIARKGFLYVNEEIKRKGIVKEEILLIIVIGKMKEVTLEEITRHFNFEKKELTENLQNLVRNGFMEIDNIEESKDIYRLTNDKGQKTFKEICELLKHYNQIIMQEVNEMDLDITYTTLLKIKENMDTYIGSEIMN